MPSPKTLVLTSVLLVLPLLLGGCQCVKAAPPTSYSPGYAYVDFGCLFEQLNKSLGGDLPAEPND